MTHSKLIMLCCLKLLISVSSLEYKYNIRRHKVGKRKLCLYCRKREGTFLIHSVAAAVCVCVCVVDVLHKIRRCLHSEMQCKLICRSFDLLDNQVKRSRSRRATKGNRKREERKNFQIDKVDKTLMVLC